MYSSDPVLDQMLSRIKAWEPTSDGKALFLRCYMRMTSNMLVAVSEDEFRDAAWVTKLLRHFAGYYFNALDAYENAPASAPAVWQIAHNVAGAHKTTPIQKLMLGVNAHINFDLVLTLDDLLRSEWSGLSRGDRELRYRDHCHVNDVISRTIDAVQDEILEPSMPSMAFVDVLMGPVDEYLISRLIRRWRESVWHNAVALSTAADDRERDSIIQDVENQTMSTARLIADVSHLKPYRS